ncbi:Cation efflux protein cytoplasmic domain-containing protein [Plasmodiophora brassicae]|uniref:Cation efflux protein transmembrane domain-containing protein n=1 Tax=Plasmodiophora brassicae TaxID=37360 RepID=A0A0G4J6P3_PLABS|nr:hypothetical protein PBRA_009277 [Plasmodiophora brassicae]
MVECHDLSSRTDSLPIAGVRRIILAVPVREHWLSIRRFLRFASENRIMAEDMPAVASTESQVLDRQGFGTVLYRSPSGKVIRTAHDLLAYMVPDVDLQRMKPTLAAFYTAQNAQIEDMLTMERHIHNVTADVRRPRNGSGSEVSTDVLFYHNAIIPLSRKGSPKLSGHDRGYWDRHAVYAITSGTCLNLGLAVLNIYLAYRTGSLSVAASTADTILDLLTTTILNISAWMRRRRDPYNYPLGKTRLEPIGTLLFAGKDNLIMELASLYIFVESVQKLFEGPSTSSALPIEMVVGGYIINAVCKIVIIVYCTVVARNLSSSSSNPCSIVAKEQTFDLLTYTCGFGAAALSAVNNGALWFIDPVAAMLLSLYIMTSWMGDAREHITRLVGKTADSRTIASFTYLALRHDSRICWVDDVKAVYIGENLMVEVHIGLPGEMPLRDSHDIGESLQIKLEGLETVEIAHVHTDYLYCHPWKEHSVQ